MITQHISYPLIPVTKHFSAIIAIAIVTITKTTHDYLLYRLHGSLALCMHNALCARDPGLAN